MRALSSSFALLSLAGVLAGCVASLEIKPLDDDDNPPAAPPPTNPVQPNECLTGVGFGTINITINNLPEGLEGKVRIEGPTPNTATATATFGESTAGNYTVVADNVAGTDAIVRPLYGASPANPTFCLAAGDTRTVVVDYAQIATSNRLFASNQSSTSGDLHGYTSSQLGATAAVTPSLAATGAGGDGIAFDRQGNLWSFFSNAEAPVLRFDTATLASGGAKTPSKRIKFNPQCTPAVTSGAFDKDGNLWVSSKCSQKVFRIPAATLAGEGDADLDLATAEAVEGLTAPEGIAFDKDGNLFIADETAIVRVDAGSLAATRAIALTVTVTDNPPNALAFDKDGNLFGTSFTANTVFKLLPADLQGTGTKDIAPTVSRHLDVTDVLEGIAIDDSGAVWVTLGVDTLARIGSDQLIPGGDDLIPSRVITGTDTAYGKSLAFFPAASGLPLYSSY